MGTLSSLWYIIYMYAPEHFPRGVRELVKNFTKSWQKRYLFRDFLNPNLTLAYKVSYLNTLYYLASFGSSRGYL